MPIRFAEVVASAANWSRQNGSQGATFKVFVDRTGRTWVAPVGTPDPDPRLPLPAVWIQVVAY